MSREKLFWDVYGFGLAPTNHEYVCTLEAKDYETAYAEATEMAIDYAFEVLSSMEDDDDFPSIEELQSLYDIKDITDPDEVAEVIVNHLDTWLYISVEPSIR